jgi:SH3-like domain-containing protein
MTRAALLFISLFFLNIFFTEPSHSKTPPAEKYVYLRASKVNLRAGPSFRYPIKWTINKRGEPLKVLGKFYQWINVETIHKNKGWLQVPMISTRYMHGIVISKNKKPLIAYAMPSSASKKIVKLELGVRLRVLKCKANKWCKIRTEKFKAWIPRKNIWGINLTQR